MILQRTCLLNRHLKGIGLTRGYIELSPSE